jgi:hypothetical protein
VEEEEEDATTVVVDKSLCFKVLADRNDKQLPLLWSKRSSKQLPLLKTPQDVKKTLL